MLNAIETAVLDDLAGRRQEMLDLLQQLVDVDSGSYCKAGVDRVIALLQRYLESSDVSCEVIPHATAGNVMRAGGNDRGKSILLLGHCDTVFPEGTARKRPFRIEGARGFGPGVADMKSGLVMNAFVLAALRRQNLRPETMGLFTADEEIASPASGPVIEKHVRQAQVVFNSEPGRPNGNVVVSRKGATFLRFEVTGKAVHAGVDHRNGVNAIEVVSRKVQKLHAMTDYDAGITVNVGLISGGVSVNTVPPLAQAEVEARFPTVSAMEGIRERMRHICCSEELPGSKSRITREGLFMPMVESAASRSVLDLYISCASAIGLTVEGEATGGSSDSGLASALGVPALCALGPVGGNVHRDDEYCELDSLVPRGQALALAIMRLKA